jgi:transcription elongation factor GreB
MPGTRYRPPSTPSTALITRAGHDRLKAELERLWRVERPEVVAALAAAAAEGDRSENAEYTYRKRQLAGIDRRVRYLTRRLAHLKVVDTIPGDREAVYFGAWVRVLLLESDSEREHRIVGPDEIDTALGWISIDSPFARALLKRRVDDEFDFEHGGAVSRVLILAVSYAGPVG